MFDFLKPKSKSALSYFPLSRDILNAYNNFRPEGKQKLLCYVPFTSLTFSWQGTVYACSYNRQKVVGRYPQQSLREIWHGSELKKLQNHIEHNDLNYGCQHCKYFIERGKFSGLKPFTFDKYAVSEKHAFPKVLEFELSNKCNLECIMCNGYTSSSIRQNRDKLPPIQSPYDDAFVEQLREFIPHLTEAKFYGGEPFLIPTYFQIMELMMELNPMVNIFVITNGTVLTEKVKSLLRRGDFNMAVSIDSLQKETFELIRKNADFEQVMSNLDYFNDYAKSRGKEISLSFTTQKYNWKELPAVVKFCNEKGMVFFNSFLKEPLELSLISVSSAELREVHTYLSGFNLPESNRLERQNKTVYTDYIRYIEQYHIKNKISEDLGEVINSDVPLTDSPLITKD